MGISVGATAKKTFVVTELDTAVAMGSGDVPVLGTPRLIAWCEEVTVLALEPELEPGMTTVGNLIRVDHLSPTAVGASVEVGATVTAVDGRQVTLEVSADDGAVAARGSITRVIVDRRRFLAKLDT